MEQLQVTLNSLKDSDDPASVVSNIIDMYNDKEKIEYIEAIRKTMYNVYRGGTINSLCYLLQGKTVSVLLNAVFNSYARIKSGDSEYLEKYILDTDNPTVICNPGFVPDKNITLREEMLEVMKLIGIKETGVLYLLVMLHVGNLDVSK